MRTLPVVLLCCIASLALHGVAFANVIIVNTTDDQLLIEVRGVPGPGTVQITVPASSTRQATINEETMKSVNVSASIRTPTADNPNKTTTVASGAFPNPSKLTVKKSGDAYSIAQ